MVPCALTAVTLISLIRVESRLGISERWLFASNWRYEYTPQFMEASYP